MNQDYANWIRFMKASRGRWTVDPIHNGVDRDLIAFVGKSEDGTAGVYVSVDDDGKAQAGDYEGALPHIGDATFTPRWEHKYEDKDAAIARLSERLGVNFLMGVMFGQSPYRSV